MSNIRFKINDVYADRLKRRAKKLRLPVSTYLRLLIHMDERLKTFGAIMTATKISSKFLKEVDNKLILNGIRKGKKT